MTDAGLQKYFHRVPELQAHPFFRDTGLKEDLDAGKVFPAIRKNEVNFYYAGARLCAFRGKQMYTSSRYLGAEGKSSEVRIEDHWFSAAKYQKIKTNCEKRRGPTSELRIVSELFREFSIARSDLPADRAVLLDIECRFPGSEKAQDMIDCVFLTPEGTLVFVEAKLTTNNAARGIEGSEPAVVCQLKRYRQQLQSQHLRDQIRDDFVRVSATLGEILGGRQLPAPKTVFADVPLLFVGRPSSVYAKDVWQRDLLKNPSPNEWRIIVIDGRNNGVGMIPALHDFFRQLAGKPVEAAP
ncbi:MAG: hypothetical protein PS018_05915 [bacterium]|nr:hypothetical protein [bacterium]